MPSGYEKSPDYGGEPPTLGSIAAAVALMVAVGVAYALATKPKPKECWTLGQDEIAVTEVNGKQRATLDLRRIPKGECVTINTSKPTTRPSQDLPPN